MNSCNFVGVLGRDWEIKYAASGKAVGKNSMAIRMGKDKTTWINLVCFEKAAEMLSQHTSKGTYLGITSEFVANEYEKDGVKKIWPEFIVRNITFCGKGNGSQQQQQQSGYQQQGGGYQQQGGYNQGQNQGGGQQGYQQQGVNGQDSIPF